MISWFTGASPFSLPDNSQQDPEGPCNTQHWRKKVSPIVLSVFVFESQGPCNTQLWRASVSLALLGKYLTHGQKRRFWEQDHGGGGLNQVMLMSEWVSSGIQSCSAPWLMHLLGGKSSISCQIGTIDSAANVLQLLNIKCKFTSL